MYTSNYKCDEHIIIIAGAFDSMLKTITARHACVNTRKLIIKVWETLLYGCDTQWQNGRE